jgi:hypothetical protein
LSQNRSRAVYQYSLNDTLIRRWNTIADITKNLGISNKCISGVCKGKWNTSGGYKWRYCDQVDVLEGEEWRPIPYSEYPNVKASSFGRIQLVTGTITFGSKGGEYKKVTLYPPGTGQVKHFSVHHLVAATFHGLNDDPNIIINHKDGIKDNNRADNLEYITKKENNEHAIQFGLKPVAQNLYKRKIIQLDLNGNIIAEHESVTQAAQQVGRACVSIRKACSDSKKTSGGYRWRYADSN